MFALRPLVNIHSAPARVTRAPSGGIVNNDRYREPQIMLITSGHFLLALSRLVLFVGEHRDNNEPAETGNTNLQRVRPGAAFRGLDFDLRARYTDVERILRARWTKVSI